MIAQDFNQEKVIIILKLRNNNDGPSQGKWTAKRKKSRLRYTTITRMDEHCQLKTAISLDSWIKETLGDDDQPPVE